MPGPISAINPILDSENRNEFPFFKLLMENDADWAAKILLFFVKLNLNAFEAVGGIDIGAPIHKR